MNKHHFSLSEDSVILVETQIDGSDFSLALDTAATQTIVDLNALLIAGQKIDLQKSRKTPFETSNGIIEAAPVRVREFSALGIFRKDFEIFTYDFLLAGIISPYEGLLGLDFFKNETILTLDFQKEEIWVIE